MDHITALMEGIPWKVEWPVVAEEILRITSLRIERAELEQEHRNRLARLFAARRENKGISVRCLGTIWARNCAVLWEKNEELLIVWKHVSAMLTFWLGTEWDDSCVYVFLSMEFEDDLVFDMRAYFVDDYL